MNAHSVVGKVGKFNVCFREERLTSHAGVVMIKELADRLGVEQLLTEALSVKTRARGYSEGQAIGGLVYNLLLGGTCLSDLAVLRGDGGTQELLGVGVRSGPKLEKMLQLGYVNRCHEERATPAQGIVEPDSARDSSGALGGGGRL